MLTKVAGKWRAMAALAAGMREREVRGTADVLGHSRRRGEEVGGVVVVGGSTVG